MGRFDREDGSGELPKSLGAATQNLRTTVEEKLREIVEAAEARAHEIEDRALSQGLEIEQDSEQKARRRFQNSTERAEQMLVAIDAFEREIATSLQTLRAKGQALAVELGAQIPATPATEEAQAVAEEAAADEPAPAPETAGPEDAREGVRRRILDLFLAGEPRVEAERMLGSLEDGGRYIDLLDEVYESRAETQQGSSRRRGGRRRRRPGSPE